MFQTWKMKKKQKRRKFATAAEAKEDWLYRIKKAIGKLDQIAKEEEAKCFLVFEREYKCVYSDKWDKNDVSRWNGDFKYWRNKVNT